MKNAILNFFLLVLGILLDFYSDAGYKDSRFSKIIPNKRFEFIPNKKNDTIIFKLSFISIASKS